MKTRSLLRLVGWKVLWLFAIGCQAPHPAPHPAAGSAGPSEQAFDGGIWLRKSAQRAQEAGAGALHVLAAGAGTAGDHLAGLVNVPAERCVLFMARGSSSLQDIDLFVYGDDGSPFGSDEAIDNQPTMLICPERGVRLYASARVVGGHGLLALGVQDVPGESVEHVARALGVRGLESSPEETENWPGLNEALATHRGRMGGAWEEQRRVAVPVDSRVPTRLSTQLAANTCLDALALSTPEIVQLNIEVLDETGRIFGRSQSGLPRSLLVCSAEEARVTFQLRPHLGRGLVLLVLSATRAHGSGDLDPEIPRAQLVAPRSSRADGIAAPKPGTFRARAATGGRRSLSLPWKGGCGRVNVESEGDLLGLDTYLWSPADELLAQSEGLTKAQIFVCSPRADLRLDVEATRRQGAFRVWLEHDRGPLPQEFLSHPLAASRLLDRLHRVGQIERPSEVGQLRTFRLTHTRKETFDWDVPVRRCLDVFLGVGPGAAGAEIRLIDRMTGEELELARAPASAHARACAIEQGTLFVTAEIRSAGGSGVGLVATRLLGGAP